MSKLFVLLGAAAVIAVATPAAAQSTVDTPFGGVRVGESRYHHRDYDRPPVQPHRRVFRERDVGMRSSCRSVMVKRSDGSMDRIHRCD